MIVVQWCCDPSSSCFSSSSQAAWPPCCPSMSFPASPNSPAIGASDCPWKQQKRQPVEKLHTRLGRPPPPPQSKTRTTTTTRTTRTSSATTTTTQEKGSFQTKSLDEIGCCTGAQEPADWGYVQLCLQHGAHPDRIHVSACLGHAETSNMQGMGRWALVALLSENLFISLGVKWRPNCMLVERPTVPTLQARHHPKLVTCGVLQQQVQAWCLECRDRRFRSTRKESHCHCGSHRDCNSGVDLAFRHYRPQWRADVFDGVWGSRQGQSKWASFSR